MGRWAISVRFRRRIDIFKFTDRQCEAAREHNHAINKIDCSTQAVNLNLNAMKSWKTTLGGILAAVGVGLRKTPQTASYADLVEGVGVVLLGMSARDNGVSSEAAGVKPYVTQTQNP